MRQGVHRAAATAVGALAVALVVALGSAGCGSVPEELDPGPPSAEVLALAEEMAPTDAGREAFLDAHPRLVSYEEVERACIGAPGGDWWGCYTGDVAVTGARQILLFDAPDDRLHGYLVGAATWGLLSAAYDGIGDLGRVDVDALVQAELDALPADHPVREEVADQTGGDPTIAARQAFAILGSSMTVALNPTLEARYAEFLTDRVATVGIEQANDDALEAMGADLSARWDTQAATEQANADARAALDSDAAHLASTRESYNDSVEEYNALSPEQRASSTTSWTLWDGTVIASQQTGSALAAALEHLTWAAADQQARREALDGADAAAAASREGLEAVAADLDALWALLGPPNDET